MPGHLPHQQPLDATLPCERDWREGSDRGEKYWISTLVVGSGNRCSYRKQVRTYSARCIHETIESTWSEVVGVEMVPVEYPTRRRIHATRAGEEESKLARRGCSPGMVGMGQPGKEFGKLQATKHGTVLKLGCTHVSVFESGRHGGAVPWSKGPEPNAAGLPCKSRVPSSPASVSECPHRAAGASETLRVAMLVQIVPRLGGGPRRLVMIHDP